MTPKTSLHKVPLSLLSQSSPKKLNFNNNSTTHLFKQINLQKKRESHRFNKFISIVDSKQITNG